MATRRRTYVLAGLLAVVALLTTVSLWNVLATVFLAVTVAYVLFPFSEWLVDRGLSKRLAAAAATIVAFVAGTLVAVPPVAALYRPRRRWGSSRTGYG